MRLKIFRAVGKDEVERLEERVNLWLELLEKQGHSTTEVQTFVTPVSNPDKGADVSAIIIIWHKPNT